VRLGVRAVRAELGALASIRFALGLATPERTDVELLVPRAVLPLVEQTSASKGQLVRKSAPVSAARRVPKLLRQQMFESRELAEEQRLARRVRTAWPRLAVVQERPMAGRGRE
jgi:hypothetical protein